MQVIRDENGSTIFIKPLLRQFNIENNCALNDCESENKNVTTIIKLDNDIFGICENCYTKIKEAKK